MAPTRRGRNTKNKSFAATATAPASPGDASFSSSGTVPSPDLAQRRISPRRRIPLPEDYDCLDSDDDDNAALDLFSPLDTHAAVNSSLDVDDGSDDDDDDEELDHPDVEVPDDAADDDDLEMQLEQAEESLSLIDQLPLSRTLPSFPTLYGLPRDICGQAASTESGTKTIFRWHVLYCRTIDRNPPFVDPSNAADDQKFGLNLYNPSSFTATTADCQGYDVKFLGGMFAFLNMHGTSGLMGKAKVFYNAHLRAEHRIRMMHAKHPNPQPGGASVGNNPDVKKYLKSSLAQSAGRAMRDCEDLHDKIDCHITEEEIHRLLELAFHSPDQMSRVSKLDAINRINFAASFTAQQQDVRRGDEHYNQRAVQRFTRTHRNMGPPPGMQAAMFISRQAKHNKDNRIEIMGVAPHVDPIRCASSWQGLNWLYRMKVMREKLVCFDADGKFDFESSYDVPTFRSSMSGRKRSKFVQIGKDIYRKNWESFYVTAAVLVSKLTSIWRLMAIHEMDDHGLSDSQMNRASGHRAAGKDQSKAQAQNYQTNVSIHVMVQRAGGSDCKNPKMFHVPRTTVKVLVSKFVAILCAEDLQTWKDKIYNEFKQCRTHRQRKESRLITAKGYVDAIVFDVENAIRFLASRPVDPVTKLITDSENLSFFDKYRFSSTFIEVFNLPAFRHPLWQQVKDAVRAAEDLAGSQEIDVLLSQPVHNEISRNRHEFMSFLQKSTQHLHTQQREFQDAVFAELAELRNMQCSSDSTLHPSIHSSSTNPQQSLATLPQKPLIQQRPIGGKLNKRAPVPMDQIRAAELPMDPNVARPIWIGKDSSFVSYDDWWNFYLEVLKPLEDANGVLSKRDEYVNVYDPATGTTTQHLPRHNKNWFQARHAIWDVARHRIFPTDGSDPEDEETVLSEYRALFDSCRPRKDGAINFEKKPTLEKLKSAFMKELDRMGKKTKGRPKGASTAPKRNRVSLVTLPSTSTSVIPPSQKDTQLPEIPEDYRQRAYDSARGSIFQTEEERIVAEQERDKAQAVAREREAQASREAQIDANYERSKVQGGYFLHNPTQLHGYNYPPGQNFFQLPPPEFVGPNRLIAPSLLGPPTDHRHPTLMEAPPHPAFQQVPAAQPYSARARQMMEACVETERRRGRRPVDTGIPNSPLPSPEVEREFYGRNVPNPNPDARIVRQMKRSLELGPMRINTGTYWAQENAALREKRAREESARQQAWHDAEVALYRHDTGQPIAFTEQEKELLDFTANH